MQKFWAFLTSPVITAMAAVFCGSLLDAAIKYMSGEMSLVTLVFWRFALAAVMAGGAFFAMGRRLPGWQATRFHAFRGLIHVLAAFLFFYALGKLELAEVTVLGFTAALLILPVAWIVLGERIHPVFGFAAILGFSGVVITFSGGDLTGSWTGDRLIGFLAVMASACFYALSVVLLRKRAALDGGFAVAVYANVFPAIYMAPVALIYGEPAVWSNAPALIFIAFSGMMIWVLMTSAYARAAAQKIAPVEYTALVWSALLGWHFFHEVPGAGLWLGAFLIIGACLLVIWQDAKDAKREMPDKEG